MTFYIRYRPETDLGRRFPTIKYPWRGGGFPTRERAEETLQACANAASMEIVEADQ